MFALITVLTTSKASVYLGDGSFSTKMLFNIKKGLSESFRRIEAKDT